MIRVPDQAGTVLAAGLPDRRGYLATRGQIPPFMRSLAHLNPGRSLAPEEVEHQFARIAG